MKFACIIALLFVFIQHSRAQNDTLKQDEIIYTTDEFFCDEGLQPEFPGGNTALRNYLMEHLKIPDCPIEGCSGKIVVRFIVMKTGKIAHAEIIRGIEDCPEFDVAIKTLLYEMPLWIPGKWKGEPVNTYFNLPVYVHFAK